jgi:hypothetical protein
MRVAWSKQFDALRRAALFHAQDGLCFYCRVPMKAPPFTRPRLPRDVTLEHLIPLSEGGRRGFPNEVAACNDCNGRRGTMPWLLFYCLKEVERTEHPVRVRPTHPPHPYVC